jgi:hypothetical protein
MTCWAGCTGCRGHSRVATCPTYCAADGPRTDVAITDAYLGNRATWARCTCRQWRAVVVVMRWWAWHTTRSVHFVGTNWALNTRSRRIKVVVEGQIRTRLACRGVDRNCAGCTPVATALPSVRLDLPSTAEYAWQCRLRAVPATAADCA